MIERFEMNQCDILRHLNGFKARAICECHIADGSHSIRNFYFSDIHQIQECRCANLFQLTAFLERHRLYAIGISESILSNGSNILANFNMPNLIHVICPGRRVSGVVGHCAASADNHLAALVQFPGCVVTTAAAVDNRIHIHEVLIGDVVLLCVILRISARVEMKLDLRHNNILIVNKGQLVQILNTVGQVNILQILTHLK